MGGKITRVISNEESQVKADREGNDINLMDHIQGLGDDSKPLPKDDGISQRTSQNGNDVYFGAFDEENKIAKSGEKRIYARDLDGNAVAEVYLKGDGDFLVKGAQAEFSSTGGRIDLTAPDGFYINGEKYDEHVHEAGDLLDGDGAPVTGQTGVKV